jgi:hypothetical protein
MYSGTRTRKQAGGKNVLRQPRWRALAVVGVVPVGQDAQLQALGHITGSGQGLKTTSWTVPHHLVTPCFHIPSTATECQRLLPGRGRLQPYPSSSGHACTAFPLRTGEVCLDESTDQNECKTQPVYPFDYGPDPSMGKNECSTGSLQMVVLSLTRCATAQTRRMYLSCLSAL